MTYAILSDIHCNTWSTFSRTNPDGVNSRLRIILNEMERAAQELIKHGGNQMVIAGDIFHVRGSVSPMVLNPLQKTVLQILDMGIDIHAIPGNHDLESKDTTELGSAIQTLGQTFSGAGVFHVFNQPELIDREHAFAFVPWASSNEDLLTQIEELAKKAGPDVGLVDLFIHAGIDGVLPGNPDHGLTAAKLGAFGFKSVFAGHYHNRKYMGHGVWSIGATSHQTWSDIGSKAGFIIIDENGDVREFDSHAPKFIDVSGMGEVDMALAADGNYVRFRGAPMKPAEIDQLRDFFVQAGALGVAIQAPRAVTSARGITAQQTHAMTLDQSVMAFVDSSKDIPAGLDRQEVKRRCADVLNAVRAVEEA